VPAAAVIPAPIAYIKVPSGAKELNSTYRYNDLLWKDYLVVVGGLPESFLIFCGSKSLIVLWDRTICLGLNNS
jgi:hypothetical protein